MNNFSKEVIDIDGVEYTLFLNRMGLVAIEKFTKEEMGEAQKLQKITSNVNKEEGFEINDDTDPFEGLEGVEELLDNSEKIQKEVYKKMFWVMLRTTHKLTPKECFDLYDRAIEIYGSQVNRLIDQIVEDVNIDKYSIEENKNVKNLKALRPTK